VARLTTRLNVVLLVAVASMAQAKAPDLLSLARQYYNEERYAEAIKVAAEARRATDTAHAAAVILSRAHLERYRQTSQAQDLDDAREALKGVEATRLAPREHVEFLIGLGESLYLDEQSGLDRFRAAAELFEIALARADAIDSRSRDLLFEWWAVSLDRQAQLGPDSSRHVLYERIVRRSEQELSRADAPTAASYWLAAGARGTDDLQRAWGAAVAGWIRASSLGTRGAALRNDLDKLVAQVILPERAQQLAAGGDARAALTILQQQWDDLKKRWGT
jgi:hypothetical protein